MRGSWVSLMNYGRLQKRLISAENGEKLAKNEFKRILGEFGRSVDGLEDLWDGIDDS